MMDRAQIGATLAALRPFGGDSTLPAETKRNLATECMRSSQADLRIHPHYFTRSAIFAFNACIDLLEFDAARAVLGALLRRLHSLPFGTDQFREATDFRILVTVPPTVQCEETDGVLLSFPPTHDSANGNIEIAWVSCEFWLLHQAKRAPSENEIKRLYSALPGFYRPDIGQVSYRRPYLWFEVMTRASHFQLAGRTDLATADINFYGDWCEKGEELVRQGKLNSKDLEQMVLGEDRFKSAPTLPRWAVKLAMHSDLTPPHGKPIDPREVFPVDPNEIQQRR